MRRVLAILAMIAGISAACGLPMFGPSRLPTRVNLAISNGTALTVSLFVNGVRAGVFAPGDPGPSIDVSALPVLPWTVEAQSSSGRVLTSMRVDAKDAFVITRTDGSIESGGAMGRVDLSCGRLTIWAGDVMPSGPVPASPPGTPGDCEP